MMMRDSETIRNELRAIEDGENKEPIYKVYSKLIDAVIDDDVNGIIDHYANLITLFRKHVSAESLAFLSYSFSKALDIYTERLLDDEEDENVIYMQQVADIMEDIIDEEDD